MATSVVPALIDALVAKTRTALSPPSVVLAEVYDGIGVTEDAGDSLSIGVDDPDSNVAANSASTSEDWANVGLDGQRDEDGTIACAAISWNGDVGDVAVKAARDAVYAIAAQVANTLRADPTLGLTNVLWTSFGTSSELNQIQASEGSMALLTFRIYFRARI